MKGYAETDIFSRYEIEVYLNVQRRIALLGTDRRVRCHELARAAERLISTTWTRVFDGKYGAIDHSWVVIFAPRELHKKKYGNRPVILDVYVPGQLPQVQLIDTSGLLPTADLYKPGPPREDIDEELVARLVEELQDILL